VQSLKRMKLKSYFTESYKELVHKTTWPTWAELQTSSIVVMIATAILALIIFVMDFSFEKIMNFIYKLIY